MVSVDEMQEGLRTLQTGKEMGRNFRGVRELQLEQWAGQGTARQVQKGHRKIESGNGSREGPTQTIGCMCVCVCG